MIENSWSTDIYHELEVDKERDILVSKFRLSGFWDSRLDSVLRRLGVDTLLFAGLSA